ncbi:MAG: flagellin [Candidatus Omnitrophota bacterium]
MSITRINNNVAAISATRHLNATSNNLSKNIERLSSGLRINRAGDDAAGLTIRERLRTQIRGTDQAIQNAENGISMVNTTEAALDSMVSSLQRIRELAIAAGNTGTFDSAAIQAIQDEVFQQVDEVNRIATTARFSTRLLFTGDNANATSVKAGQDDIGVGISNDPNASNLRSGVSILNVIRTKEGSEKIIPYKKEDGQAIFATGIKDATDIAVTTGRFLNGANAAAYADNLSGLTFDGVSVAGSDIITFQGVLSDGITPFTGALSVSSAGGPNTMQNLMQQVQTAIDNAEIALFGGVTTDIPSTFVQTHVSLPLNTLTQAEGSGRIRFLSAKAGGTSTTTNADATAAPSQFNIQFSVISSTGDLKLRIDSTRDFVRGMDVGAQYGNTIQAITGSTFDSGNFKIDVSDVTPPNRRKLETTLTFSEPAGSIITRSTSLAGKGGAVLNGTFVNGIFTTGDNGIRFAADDTITIQGTQVDGSTFETTFTISTDPNDDADLDDARITTLGGLVDELNYRNRLAADGSARLSEGFQKAMVTLTGEGHLQLIDDIADSSQSNIFLRVQDRTYASDEQPRTMTDRAEVIIYGNPEEATISMAGGPLQRVRVGDTVVLYGEEPTKFNESQQRLTITLGAGARESIGQSIFNKGYDTVEIEAQLFYGSLNGGPQVAFQNGDTNVFFESGFSEGVAETLMLDFDNILDITGPPSNGDPNTGVAILLSTVNSALNFQVGPFKGQDLQVNIPDLRGDNLGFGRGSGKTVSDINVTTISGVNTALEIIDQALDQVSRTRSTLGAFTNRLDTTISSLSVSSENLSASESRLSDVDMASEVSNFTSNQILFQAGTSVLAQANFLPQGLLSLLG